MVNLSAVTLEDEWQLVGGLGLLAAVEQVDALDVARTHLHGRAEGGVAVRKAHHGGEEAVLGEGQSAGSKSSNAWSRTQDFSAAERWSCAPLRLTCRSARPSRSRRTSSGSGCQTCRS